MQSAILDYVCKKLAFDDNGHLLMDIGEKWSRQVALNREFHFNGIVHGHLTIVDNGKRDSKIIIDNVGSVTLTERYKEEVMKRTGGDWEKVTEHLFMTDNSELILDMSDSFERALLDKDVDGGVSVSFRQKGTKIICSADESGGSSSLDANLFFVVLTKDCWANTGFRAINAHSKSDLIKLCDILFNSMNSMVEDNR